MVAKKEDNIKAEYKAESGVETVISEIIENPNVELSELQSITGDGFVIDSVSTETGEEMISYTISATGSEDGVNKTINVIIMTNIINITTVNSGSNIDTELTINILGIEIPMGSTDISGGEEENLSDLPDFRFERSIYVNEDENGDVVYDNGEPDVSGKLADYYYPDQDSFENDFTTGFWDIPGWGSLGTEVDLPPGKTIYVDGDLSLSSIFADMNGGTPTEPAIIVVNGNLTYSSGVNGISDVVFIVKEDFNLNQEGLFIDRSFIYTEGAINIGGNLADFSFYMDADGIFVSKEDATIKSVVGSVEYEEVDLRNAYKLLSEEDQSKLKPRLIYWD